MSHSDRIAAGSGFLFRHGSDTAHAAGYSSLEIRTIIREKAAVPLTRLVEGFHWFHDAVPPIRVLLKFVFLRPAAKLNE